jgi:hypothetical protein
MNVDMEVLRALVWPVVLLKCIQVQLRLLYELYELLRDGDQP